MLNSFVNKLACGHDQYKQKLACAKQRNRLIIVLASSTYLLLGFPSGSSIERELVNELIFTHELHTIAQSVEKCSHRQLSKRWTYSLMQMHTHMIKAPHGLTIPHDDYRYVQYIIYGGVRKLKVLDNWEPYANPALDKQSKKFCSPGFIVA